MAKDKNAAPDAKPDAVAYSTLGREAHEEFVERMHRLEAWEKSARAEISIRTPTTR